MEEANAVPYFCQNDRRKGTAHYREALFTQSWVCKNGMLLARGGRQPSFALVGIMTSTTIIGLIVPISPQYNGCLFSSPGKREMEKKYADNR
jgi:hypothetical protein